MCSQRNNEPRRGPNWFGTDPFFAIDVRDWKAGEELRFDSAAALSFPPGQSGLAPGQWTIQAVIRLNLDAPGLSAPGNACSAPLRVTIPLVGPWDGPSAEAPAAPLVIDSRLPESLPPEDPRLRVVTLESKLLSAFHGRTVLHRATVVLPQGYDGASDRRYPAEYWITGFGGNHAYGTRSLRQRDQIEGSENLLLVVLDPQCFGGHHTFADSANNGPRGTALVTEFIPWLESQFRIDARPAARFVSGISSGGWTSLWLQVAYPDFFGGCWSFAPDPVDFSHFQNVDLYASGANMLDDLEGKPIPLGQSRGRPILFSRPFTEMETVLGEGGQLRSFEWVFSPRGVDGLPTRVYDRTSGAIDAVVAKEWKKYDIRLILERGWETLGPKLGGKINVFVGDQDTFYLHHAVVSLKAALERLGSDAVIEIHEGKDHGSVMSREMLARAVKEMAERAGSPPDRAPAGENPGSP